VAERLWWHFTARDRADAEASRRITQRGSTIDTFMLHDSPELAGFVERMTEINHGRALLTDPHELGSYVLVDHLYQPRTRR
jgi:uncharacterized protein with von Willebrand factor type A (vWA) domain